MAPRYSNKKSPGSNDSRRSTEARPNDGSAMSTTDSATPTKTQSGGKRLLKPSFTEQAILMAKEVTFKSQTGEQRKVESKAKGPAAKPSPIHRRLREEGTEKTCPQRSLKLKSSSEGPVPSTSRQEARFQVETRSSSVRSLGEHREGETKSSSKPYDSHKGIRSRAASHSPKLSRSTEKDDKTRSLSATPKLDNGHHFGGSRGKSSSQSLAHSSKRGPEERPEHDKSRS